MTFKELPIGCVFTDGINEYVKICTLKYAYRRIGSSDPFIAHNVKTESTDMNKISDFDYIYEGMVFRDSLAIAAGKALKELQEFHPNSKTSVGIDVSINICDCPITTLLLQGCIKHV